MKGYTVAELLIGIAFALLAVASLISLVVAVVLAWRESPVLGIIAAIVTAAVATLIAGSVLALRR